MSKRVSIYVDGSAIRPGGQKGPVPGGWAALLLYRNNEKLISGGARETTANRMELVAIIQGFRALKQKGLVVEVFTDSKNAIGWLSGTYQANDPDIRELVRLYDEASEGQIVIFEKVKGHSGNDLNEKVDRVAQERARTAAELAQLAWLYEGGQVVETEWPPKQGG